MDLKKELIQLGKGKIQKYKKPQALNPLEAIQILTKEIKEYKIVAEQEKTKRKNITAWENTTLEKIKSQKEIILKYLDSSFDERKSNFESLFASLDKSLDSNNTEQMGIVLNTILDLAKSSPFKDIMNNEKLQDFIDDKKMDMEL
ncbi:MAG: hypothetical protein IPQ05_18240 [Leptospiraceae bacterium]|nr:hypothetical protein [Leptospiraceae bacterium]